MAVKRLILALLIVGSWTCVSYAQEVSVSTDKQEYLPGEIITIKVLNNSGRSIFSLAAGSTPDFAISNIERKLSRWSWDAFRLHSSGPERDADSGAPAEIKSGKSKSFRWKPQAYLDKKYVVPHPGLYRMTVIYQLRKDSDAGDWIWKTVKSNEFTLK